METLRTQILEQLNDAKYRLRQERDQGNTTAQDQMFRITRLMWTVKKELKTYQELKNFAESRGIELN